MPIRRVFLPWDRPILPAAATWLVNQFRQQKRADLREGVVVVPGRRAGRRLLELLVQVCEQEGLVLSPPTITTEGSFPELLYVPKRPFANRLTQQLAWAKALAATPTEIRQRIVPHPPPSSAHDRWLSLGDMLRKQHLDLAADGLSFADVAERGSQLEEFDEQGRWEALAAVQTLYLKTLDALQIWDVQSARLFAIKHREPATSRPIFLLGTVDLNLAMRQMLDLIADQVTALIAAPQNRAQAFDSHGCLEVAYWREHRIEIPPEKILSAAGPQEQAEQVAVELSKLGQKRRGDEITVGVADESLVPQLQRRLEEGGVPVRWGVGRTLAETQPYRFLQAVAEYCERKSYEAFAKLIRHPDVYAWIQQQRVEGKQKFAPCYLAEVDAYYADYLPRQLTGEWHGKKEDHATIEQVWSSLEKLLAELPNDPQSLAVWCVGVRKLLATIYGVRLLDTAVAGDRELIEVGRKIDAAIASLEEVPASLQPKLSLSLAMPLLLDPLADDTIPPPAQPEAIEILGWLELSLDDAPSLIVTTFNEGFVPQSQHADCFLPNRLREHLGLLDNERRYARDAYATQVLLASREDLSVIVGKRDADGNPLAPSRLLFARAEDEVVPLALRLFGPPTEQPAPRSLLTDRPAPERSAFEIPRPEERPHWDDSSISVTHFRSYLACPYRYYLQYVLRLRGISDSDVELTPPSFGNLIHDVLQAFGSDPAINRQREPDKIAAYLNDQLNTTAARRLGKMRRGAINIQIEQARNRLQAFAAWQAQRAQQGWEIAYTETERTQLRTTLKVDDVPITLVGRIDRIDWNGRSQMWQILDYKTADTRTSPVTFHRKRDGRWTDLQLPMYRHLARTIPFASHPPLSDNLELGYVHLPKDVTKIGEEIAKWSLDDLVAADDAAYEVIRAIRGRRFWPPSDEESRYESPFAAICQDNLLDRPLFGENLVGKDQP